MTDFVMAQCDVSVHFVGGEYVNFGGELASFKPNMEATLAEEKVLGRTYPYYTVIGMTGGIAISGLRTGPASDAVSEEFHVDGRRQAFFSVIHKTANMLGPCGYVMLQSGDLINADGVFKLDGGGLAMPGDGFATWRYGTVLPRLLNSFRTAPSTGYPTPVQGQMAVINVINAGNLTQLEVLFRARSGTTYSLAAIEKSSRVVPGITRGPLMASSASVPANALTGGQWQIRTAGSTNAEFYVGLIHEFA